MHHGLALWEDCVMETTTTVEGRKSNVESQSGGAPAPRKRAAGRAAVQGKWREISGISVENERTMSAKERRAAIRKLKAVVEREIRAELKEAAEDAEFKGERTFLWEPIPAICHRLEIGPAVLSRLMRELTGLSVAQMVDKIRAEGMKEKLRENLRDCFKKYWHKPGHAKWGVSKISALLDEFWRGLKALRRSGSFSYATWAIELGFANYTRFYRACVLQYGMTPTQLEHAVLCEYAEWYSLATDLGERVHAQQAKWNKMLERYRPPYNDEWAAAMKERPEFIARMRAELELAEDVWEEAGK